MVIRKGHKVIIAILGIALWLFPQKTLGEDTEIKSQLSYISKIIGVMESSIIKIKGDVRFVKRQAEKTIIERKISANRLNNLEKKINRLDDLLNEITVNIAKLNMNLERVEKDLGSVLKKSCSSTRLCRGKK
jgi:chromosome segregation ATPase